VWTLGIFFDRFEDATCEIKCFLWVEISISAVERLQVVISVFNLAGRFENRTPQEEFHGMIEKEMRR